jgi:hypothetical protein
MFHDSTHRRLVQPILSPRCARGEYTASSIKNAIGRIVQCEVSLNMSQVKMGSLLVNEDSHEEFGAAN